MTPILDKFMFEVYKGTKMTDPANPNRRADPRLLDILVCPVTKTPLRYDAAAQELISDKAGLAFPIREGIPIMLADEARKIAD